jgi:hypothetical protein
MSKQIDWDSILREAEREMARAKTPVWMPLREGDALYGIVVDVRPNPWNMKVKALIIRTPDGKEFMTPRNQMLLSQIEYWQPQVGDAVVIRYDGESSIRKSGRSPAKLFSMYVKRLSGEPREVSVEKPLEVEEKVEEMEAEIETAEESEERGFEEQAEELEAELESAKNYLLNELLQIYGSIHKNKLDKLLMQKGYKVTSEGLLKAFGSELAVSKHGYIQKREK